MCCNPLEKVYFVLEGEMTITDKDGNVYVVHAGESITNSRSSPKLTSIESVMPSSHLILCRPLLLLPSIFPSIGVFSSESVLDICEGS